MRRTIRGARFSQRTTFTAHNFHTHNFHSAQLSRRTIFMAHNFHGNLSRHTTFAAHNFHGAQLSQHTTFSAHNFLCTQFSRHTIFTAHNFHTQFSHVVSNTDLEIGKTSESSERLGLAWFIKLAPRQQHGVPRRFSDYNKALSTIYTRTKPKYLVRAERGARGKKNRTWQESESTAPANGALSPGRRYSQHKLCTTRRKLCATCRKLCAAPLKSCEPSK